MTKDEPNSDEYLDMVALRARYFSDLLGELRSLAKQLDRDLLRLLQSTTTDQAPDFEFFPSKHVGEGVPPDEDAYVPIEGPSLDVIVHYLRHRGDPASAAQIAHDTGVPIATVRAHFRKKHLFRTMADGARTLQKAARKGGTPAKRAR